MGDTVVSQLIEAVATHVAARHQSIVRRIEVTPYEDSFGRAGFHFTVHLRDKHDGDYSWADLSPIERDLDSGVQAIDPAQIPYTDYISESEEALRRAEVA